MSRTVVVTGGTGALGRAVVDAFLAEGDRVVVPWIVKGERDAMPEHDRLVLLEADVAEESGAAEVVGAAGPIDVLVNAVGGFGGGTPVAETDLALWDSMYRMNVRTAVAMSRAAVPVLRPGASVFFVSSQAHIDRPAGLAAYSASKAAIAVLAQSLQKELAHALIRVNAVVPTTIDTPANRAAMPDADFAAWTPPERIAGVLVWLASDAGTTVRGGLIPV
jgi:NAD(P)-dependent dehydrogenase (short-subunit alcohol dehydrogenase family)